MLTTSSSGTLELGARSSSTCSGDRSPSSIAWIWPLSRRRLKNSFFCAAVVPIFTSDQECRMYSWIDGADPPHGIGRQAEAAIGIEALHRLHHADIALGDELGQRQAVAAIAHRDLGDEAQMAGDQPVRRLGVVMLAPALGEHVFLLRLQHRELADLLEIARKTAFGCEAGSATAVAMTLLRRPRRQARRAGTGEPIMLVRVWVAYLMPILRYGQITIHLKPPLIPHQVRRLSKLQRFAARGVLEAERDRRAAPGAGRRPCRASAPAVGRAGARRARHRSGRRSADGRGGQMHADLMRAPGGEPAFDQRAPRRRSVAAPDSGSAPACRRASPPPSSCGRAGCGRSAPSISPSPGAGTPQTTA